MSFHKKINRLILAAVSFTFIICTLHVGIIQAQSAQNYLTFSTADELSQFMKYGSGSGPLISAHRGGPAPGIPENSIEAFERTLGKSFAILEFDIRLSKDSVLVVMHDRSLDRTTTCSGDVYEHTIREIRQCFLVDNDGEVTDFRVPTLQEVLAWSEGRGVVTIDVKREVPFPMVVDEVERSRAEGRSTIIVYNLDHMLEVHELNPDLLIAATATTMDDAEAIIESGVDLSRLSVFIGVNNLDKDLIDYLNSHGIKTIMGTFGDLDRRALEEGADLFRELFEFGVDIIATDVVDVASEAVEPLPEPMMTD